MEQKIHGMLEIHNWTKACRDSFLGLSPGKTRELLLLFCHHHHMTYSAMNLDLLYDCSPLVLML
jgi:hypothetical protein